MKALKRIILSLLILMLVFGTFAGCESDKEESAAKKVKKPEQKTASSEVSSQTESEESYENVEVYKGGLKLPAVNRDNSGEFSSPKGVLESDAELNKLSEPKPSNTDWFMKAKYGIMVHCTEHTHNNGVADDFFSDGLKTSWDECVDSIDAELFANQAEEAGAGYVILCIQQQYQFFATPIKYFEKLVGFEPGQVCSKRDLPLDMMNALSKHNIPFILYFTGDGCWRDNLAFSVLSGKAFPNAICNTEWNDTYVMNWSKMILELSLRYGKKLAGWYFDGMDGTKFNDDDLYWFAKAAKAGNPDSILSFNGAQWTEAAVSSKYEDFTFGEQFGYTYTPYSRFVKSKDGKTLAQWHMLGYLDGDQTGIMHTAKETVDYLKLVNGKQGVITFDVDMNRYGQIRPEHLAVLRDVKKAVR